MTRQTESSLSSLATVATVISTTNDDGPLVVLNMTLPPSHSLAEPGTSLLYLLRVNNYGWVANTLGSFGL